MSERLRVWNEVPEGDALREILPCNGSQAWAQGMARQRPFADAPALLEAADRVWWALSEEAWQEAFQSHPRIGERHARAATAVSLQWSAAEQGAAGDDETVKAALAEGNRLYEQRFGRTFLICATGKSAQEMLAVLRTRLQSEPETELREAAEQQRRITQLRLRKWLDLPAARCEDV